MNPANPPEIPESSRQQAKTAAEFSPSPFLFSQPVKPAASGQKNGASEGTRTLDSHLGKVALYQLSYARVRKNETAIQYHGLPVVQPEKLFFCQTSARRRIICGIRNTGYSALHFPIFNLHYSPRRHEDHKALAGQTEIMALPVFVHFVPSWLNHAFMLNRRHADSKREKRPCPFSPQDTGRRNLRRRRATGGLCATSAPAATAVSPRKNGMGGVPPLRPHGLFSSPPSWPH